MLLDILTRIDEELAEHDKQILARNEQVIAARAVHAEMSTQSMRAAV